MGPRHRGEGADWEPGRGLQECSEGPVMGRPFTAPPQVRFLVRMTYPNEAIRTRMHLCIDGVTS